jgi:hypothetical protein
MFTGQTTIGKVTARCDALTEPIVARLRFGQFVRAADLAPRGFPPQAVLVVRRASAPKNISLGSTRPRPDWEREVRELLARYWRRAARPARGHVPEGAEAVWFEDVGEWLAALGVAVERGGAARHWCWRAALGSGGAHTSRALADAWTRTPRFVPAAIVRLARWGEAARVLGLLRPEEAGAILAALRAEFDLPRVLAAREPPRAHASLAPRALLATQRGEPGQAREFVEESGGRASNRRGGDERTGPRDTREVEEAQTRTRLERWVGPDWSACARLPEPTRRLLAVAVTLFHAPALARSPNFALQVFAFNGRVSPEARHESETARREQGTDARRAVETLEEDASPFQAGAPGEAAGAETRSIVIQDDALPARPTGVVADSERMEESHGSFVPARSEATARHGAAAATGAEVASAESKEGEATAASRAWDGLDGQETALGGLLFLLNLFAHLRLPECFDEDCNLSEHITGWGLAELLGRELLGDVGEKYAGDPVWVMLARLDGRAEGEPPALGLRVGDSYRITARWLKRFAPGVGAWDVSASGGRLSLWHAGGFCVAERPLEGADADEATAREVEHFRAQGVEVQLGEASASLNVASLNAVRLNAAGVSVPASERFSLSAPLPHDLRRWMGWTFPFLKYALGRALELEEPRTGEALARALLYRRGRLFCTTTHVDLVLEMERVSLPVRRSGLDATPGWVRDLMRVVTFHYE